MTIVGLCAACHICFPSGKATHLFLERQQRSLVFVQISQADGVSIFQMQQGLPRLKGRLLPHLFPSSRQEDRYCFATAYYVHEQNDTWCNVRAKAGDGQTVDDTRKTRLLTCECSLQSPQRTTAGVTYVVGREITARCCVRAGGAGT